MAEASDLSGLVDVLVARLELADATTALVVGRGSGPVAGLLVRRGVEVEVVHGDWPSIQLPRRFAVVVVESPVASESHTAEVHCAVQHTLPSGVVVVLADHDDAGVVQRRFELTPVASAAVEGASVEVLQRTDRRTVHDVVFETRSRIVRVTATELAGRLNGGRPPLVVDTRTATDRHRFGVIPGAMHVPRTVVEWHLDPANGYRHPAVESFDRPLVLVCNGGYSSSLAAANLLDLGFTDVADLIGGHRAWVAAGLPVVAPDHSHLDL
jgi:rhodanese-related sulfurtransferase